MMIEKVLIAEDHESANLSVQRTLEGLGVLQPHYVYYCDDALLKIRKGVQDGDPYDLLVTDLYFEEDTSKQKLADGMALIKAARAVQPGLRVLVFSAEHRAAIIEQLFSKLAIDGFVRKARHDARELETAIGLIGQGQSYFPRHLAQLIGKKNVHDFSQYDIVVLSLLAQGTRQKDIPAYLRLHRIEPAGLSSIEKRLKLIRAVFEFSNNEQLIAYCKDTGII
jgi:two-component system capsular synthesis response regulator RcsB